MSAFVVVNPRSGNGRTARDWKSIERKLADVYPRMAVAFSEGRGDVTTLVREALANGATEIVFAVREEMALTLSDAVMRRTGIGQFGPPAPEALDAASKLMAKELEWSEDRRQSEIASLSPWFQTREAA